MMFGPHSHVRSSCLPGSHRSSHVGAAAYCKMVAICGQNQACLVLAQPDV